MGKTFLCYIRPYWKSLIVLVLFIILSVGFQLLEPLVTEQFLNEAKSGLRPLSDLRSTAVTVFLLSIGGLIFTMGGQLIASLVAWNSTNRLREDITLHCLNLDMAFHKQTKPGELVERIDGDIRETQSFISMLFVSIFANIPLLIGCIVMVYLRGLLLGILLTVITLVILGGALFLNRKSMNSRKKARVIQSELSGNLEEWISGREEIAAAGSFTWVVSKFQVMMAKLFRNQVHIGRWNWGTMMITRLFNILGFILVFIWGTKADNSISAGVNAYIIIKYIGIISTPLRQLSHQLKELTGAAASLSRIREILDKKSSIPAGRRDLETGVPLGVTLKNLHFAYDEEPILKNLNVAIPPGCKLGVLGRTGSGKSTLARLISRMYLPSSGSIELAGERSSVDIRELSESSLAAGIAVITQEVQLFHGTVKENLTIFDDARSDHEVIQALQNAGLSDWLNDQPGGLETRLNGTDDLSAGEAQLLSLARVFLHDPGLIILDEASSRLDPGTEQRMEKALKALLRSKTAIIIAHRLKTIQNTDQILILDKGEVAEFGRRTDLLADPGSRFKALLKTQLEEVEQ